MIKMSKTTMFWLLSQSFCFIVMCYWFYTDKLPQAIFCMLGFIMGMLYVPIALTERPIYR